jgi:hypothetical protein
LAIYQKEKRLYYNVRFRKQTGYSFIASITLHVIAVLIIAINFRIHFPVQNRPNPLLSDSTKVELYPRLPAPVLSQSDFRADIQQSASINIPKLNHNPNKRRLTQSKRSEENRTEKPINQEKIPVGTEVRISNPQAPFLFDKASNLSDPINSEPRGTKIKGGIEDIPIEENPEGDVEPRRGAGGISEADRDAQIGSVMRGIAGQVVAENITGKVDIVFLLDTSGSMEDNIHAVGNHLSDMADMFVQKELDFTLGVVKFRYVKFLVFPQTKDISRYQRLLRNVRCGGDERAYDAIVKAIAMVQFRPGAQRRFIVVTDEKMKGSYSILEVIKRSREAQITLDVIGIDDMMDKYLARQTGGIWYLIPGG